MTSILNPAVPAGAYDDFLIEATPRAREQLPWTPAHGPVPALEGVPAVQPGSVIRIEASGGGGYGDPVRRDPALRAADERDGRG